jgi:ATP-dependent Clp protease ATP-binding subunit ClpB
MTNIPLTKIMRSEKEKLSSLSLLLRERVKGQDNALNLISDAILRARSGIRDPSKPIGSFIFLGTSGVGKTEVARTLAYSLFDSESNLIRIDMSEFMEKHSISKLIGAPPGYIGFDQGNQLTEKVRYNQYGIVLFDEIEKAHPEVLNVLLQILDNGILTDSKGKKVSFKNIIIIMTSNLGSQFLLSHQENSKDQVLEEVSRHFSNEFINRIDEIVIFDPLTPTVLREIIDRELTLLSDRLLQNNYLHISFSETVKEKILSEAPDERYGARPIKRYIAKYLETAIAKTMLSTELTHDSLYQLDFNEMRQEFVLIDRPFLN